jgi:phosphatidylserine/phosphatidylglycerophosphate/cardiolipin synthase-like enzyme
VSGRIGWLLFALGLPLLLLLPLAGRLPPTHSPGSVIISEIAWGATAVSLSDEWLELYNTTDTTVALSDWTITNGNNLTITLSGAIPPNAFFLIERDDDTTISDIPADLVYLSNGQGLNDAGVTLFLRDAANQTIDTANLDGGPWPAGSGSPGFYTMERLDPSAGDEDANWVTNDGLTRNGLDAYGNPLNGTPRQPNSAWQNPPGAPAVILIDALLFDGYETGDSDEAIRLYNAGAASADLAGWSLSDNVSTISLPSGAILLPGHFLWLANEATGFHRQFGFPPAYETTDTDPAVPNLTGTWPGFSNTGDEAILRDPALVVQDVLVYKAGDTAQSGWSGPALYPYVVTGLFGEEGQILYRQRDQATGRPLTDTNTAADWAQTTADPINGRKVLYPGWQLDTFFFTTQITTTAFLTVAIAPDNAYETLATLIHNAQTSIQVETLTLESIPLANALIAAAGRGVAVTILLEGGPTGGLPDQERYICQQLEAAGGQCWFMISDAAQQIYDRYRFLHAKFMIVDSAWAVIGSENLSYDSLPNDDKTDGTWGRRGLCLITNAAPITARLQAIFAADFNPAAHADLFRWSAAHPIYGSPPAGFTPIIQSGGVTYTVRYPAATTFLDTFSFELLHAPENSLRDHDSLLGLLNRAGAGDTILAQQLSERPYWGPTNSNPLADPNPRLEAYLAAARRGATVRLLLDNYFDTPGPTSNQATCEAVNALAHTEHLNLACALANPTGLGLHNKMVLVQINGRGYVHAGSLNGTEQASKGNREVALQFQSDAAYVLLANMFHRDWPHRIYLPLSLNNYIGPAPHILISELLYDPTGPDDAEFIELVNPTPAVVDLSGYTLGDAVNPTDFEDVRRFPAATLLPPGQTLVIATTATAFQAEYTFPPDFEILESDPAVPNLEDDPLWGDPATWLQLGNSGDEVILRDPAGQPVDVITYGVGSFPGVHPCTLVAGPDHSLERFPYWRDTNDCLADFRDWPFPNPGSLP